MAEPSITHWAESSMAAAAWGSLVLAATPLAAWANVLKAWAVSRAATPGNKQEQIEVLVSRLFSSYGRKNQISEEHDVHILLCFALLIIFETK